MMYIKNKGKEMFKFTVKKSLNDILGCFNKTLEELNSFITDKEIDNKAIDDELGMLQKKYYDNEDEITEALQALNNIKKHFRKII